MNALRGAGATVICGRCARWPSAVVSFRATGQSHVACDLAVHGEDAMSGFLNEFKEFAMRGNVVDMAVGIIIGAAFGTIVSSLVADVVMPPIGMLLGNVDFSDLYI